MRIYGLPSLVSVLWAWSMSAQAGSVSDLLMGVGFVLLEVAERLHWLDMEGIDPWCLVDVECCDVTVIEGLDWSGVPDGVEVVICALRALY